MFCGLLWKERPSVSKPYDSTKIILIGILCSPAFFATKMRAHTQA